jgi:hypothetical protein
MKLSADLFEDVGLDDRGNSGRDDLVVRLAFAGP